MCGIVVGINTDEVRGLTSSNAYRGSHSHSVCYYNYRTDGLVSLKRGFGPLDIDSIDIPKNCIAIIHQQAPTTENKNIENVHPAQIGKHLLWHNGIIKEDEIKRLQEMLQITYSWDTRILLRLLVDEEKVPEINGTFACVYVGHGFLDVFRNEIAPLYYSDTAIASTKFEGSIPVPPNQRFCIQWTSGKLELSPMETFKTVENPYFFA